MIFFLYNFFRDVNVFETPKPMISVEYFNLFFLSRIKLAEKGKSFTGRKLEEIYKSRTKENSTVIPEQNCAIKVCHLSRGSLFEM